MCRQFRASTVDQSRAKFLKHRYSYNGMFLFKILGIGSVEVKMGISYRSYAEHQGPFLYLKSRSLNQPFFGSIYM
jgi:hypothetical protein